MNRPGRMAMGPFFRSSAGCPGLFIIFLIFLVLIRHSASGENDPLKPTAEVIASASEIDYPPFCLVDDEGRAHGFSVELLRAALKAMDREVTFQVGTWDEVKGMLEKGEVRALPLVGRTPEREAIFDFTFPYMSLHGAVVVRKDTPGIHHFSDLKGRSIAVMKGDNAEEFLRREDRDIRISTTDTFEIALQDLADGIYDAVVIQRLVALRLIQQTGLTNLHILNQPIEGFRQDYCFAVKEGDRETLALLNEGLAIVTADGTYRHLHSKWFAALELPSNRRLIMGGDQNYPPYEYLDEKGRPTGYNVDLSRAMAMALGLDIEIRLGPWVEIQDAAAKGEIDALQGLFYSPERDLKFDFTPPHLVNHCVGVIRKGEGRPPASPAELENKRIVVQAGDIMHDFALQQGWKDRLILVDTQGESLLEVAEGRADCALVSRLTALYWIKNKGLTNLSVGGEPFLSPGYCYAVPNNHKALLAQLSEGLKILEETGEYRRIYEKWMGVYEEQPQNLTTMLRKGAKIIGPLSLLLLAIFLWSWSLRRQVAHRTDELRKSEARYRLIADYTVDIICTMNLDLELTYVNPACLPILGYQPEEMVGNSLGRYCDEKNFAILMDAMRRAMERGPEGRGTIFEVALFHKSGAIVPMEIQGRLIFDARGNPLNVQGVARNITERKKAEEALRHQHELVREMGRMAKIGAWEYDPSDGKVTWTEEVVRIHETDQHAGMDFDTATRYYKGESRKKIITAVRKAIEQGKSYDLELEMVSAKGVHKWVRTMSLPVFENGKVVGVRGSLQDITERVQYRQRVEHLNRVLRSIRDVNQLIVHEKDPRKLIEEGCRLLVENRGYGSALIILTDRRGRPESFAQAGLDPVSEDLRRSIEMGEMPPCCALVKDVQGVVGITDRKGICARCPISRLYDEMDALVIDLHHGGITYGCLIASTLKGLAVEAEEQGLFSEMAGDIAFALHALDSQKAHAVSERKRQSLEAQLIQAQKMESVGRLAGGVAHDFNNMLSVIIGYGEMALDKTEPVSPLAGDLNEILNAARRSSDITRQLLAFARRQTIDPKPLDLNETVASMLKMLRRLMGEDIDLAWMPGLNLWWVNIDPSQVDQIMANLVVNARDAISGVGRVTIETDNVRLDEAYCADRPGFVPGEYVMLAVSDNGAGMEKRIQDKVFEPFFTTKAPGKGTGLGLATVYGIVKQNNGFINFYSEPGQGTTVKIFFPRHGEGMAAIDDASPEETLPRGSEIVFLVEDEAAILKLGKKMLESLGYRVTAASAPGMALALAAEHAGDIHLLLTDVVMPEMNGRDLSRKLQELHPGISTLFMSGYTADVIAHHGVLEAGVDFLQKPFSKKDLAEKVREILDRNQQAGPC